MSAVRVLVVEDNTDTVEFIADVLYSLSLEHRHVTNLEAARAALSAETFGLVLLDVEFPARPNGPPNMENGGILLEEIQQRMGFGRLPVIVMTGHASFGFNSASDFLALGTAALISKPFPREGRTLLAVIRQVLERTSAPPLTASAIPDPFEGGLLEIYPKRAVLLGVEIMRNSRKGTKHGVAILRMLAERDDQGRFVRKDGTELASQLSRWALIGTVTGSVGKLRANITHRLLRDLNIECGESDVIINDDQGYHLREWIEVRVVDEDENGASRTSVLSVVARAKSVGSERPDDNSTRRQQWALDQMARGVRLERQMLEKEFGIGGTTAKRELAELTRRGAAEFVRVGKTGYYRIPTS